MSLKRSPKHGSKGKILTNYVKFAPRMNFFLIFIRKNLAGNEISRTFALAFGKNP